MYETFDHTADLGLRVRAATLEELFRDAACGLSAMIVEDLAQVRPDREVHFQIAGGEPELLLFDLLRELLFRFDSAAELYSQFEVALTPGGLSVTARGEALEPSRHQLSHEVKAITYHDLSVSQEAGLWVAEVIVDI